MAFDQDKKSILIVDDNHLTRELIAAAVASASYCCKQAEGGKDALEKIKTEPFCLVFMDLLMPGMDGFETVRQIRAMGIQTPIIALSALSMKQDRERALAIGCNAFAAKPIDFKFLRELIQKYTDTTDAAPPPVQGLQNPGRSPFDYSRYRMLMIEEEPERSETHARIMAGYGFKVTRLASCDQALAMLQADGSCAEIVISNLYTTGIDAFGMLAMVRRRFPHIMVFIYTERYDPDTYQLAMQQGADGIFPAMLLDGTAIGMIESALHQRGQKPFLGASGAADQPQQAQEQLIRYGCAPPCRFCSLAFSSLHAAGGDILRCRKFNNAGRCGFVLADIAGHDLASMYMSDVFLGILSSCWDTCQNPQILLQVMNSEFNKLGYSKSHICVTAVLWDGMRRILHIATAGNPGALLYERMPDGGFSCRELDGGGMCLGLFHDTNLTVSATISCPAESRLFLFSGGLEKDYVQQAIAAAPELLCSLEAGEIGRQIMQSATAGRDDRALLSLQIPAPESRQYPHHCFASSYIGIDSACTWAADVLARGLIPSGKDADFVLLALREALLNAVEHGNRRNPDSFVDIVIRPEAECLIIEVSDEGCGFDAQRFSSWDNMQGQIGKRGLPAMHKIADRITVEGGTVSLIFNRTVK